jgi:hypothetical protein
VVLVVQSVLSVLACRSVGRPFMIMGSLLLLYAQ